MDRSQVGGLAALRFCKSSDFFRQQLENWILVGQRHGESASAWQFVRLSRLSRSASTIRRSLRADAHVHNELWAHLWWNLANTWNKKSEIIRSSCLSHWRQEDDEFRK